MMTRIVVFVSLLCAGAMCSDIIESSPLSEVVSSSKTIFVGTLLFDKHESETRDIDARHTWSFSFQRFRVDTVVRSTFPLAKGDMVRVFDANQTMRAWQSIEYEESGTIISLFEPRSASPTAIHPTAGRKVVVMGNAKSPSKLTLSVNASYEPAEELPKIISLVSAKDTL